MAKILEHIHGPADIKNLNARELKILSREIRKFLLESLSKTGGHLSPNLGVVELTIAMHYVFDSPQDKFIWDVGHQAYVHKILTGRKEGFAKLRKLDGMSGFPKRKESEHDMFDTGHSSTSISAALGYAKARDMMNQNHEIISVIGDGSFTGGMAFEAFNNAGRNNTSMKVILNDNQMSIAQNVGGLCKYLNEVRTEPIYLDAKEDLEKAILKIPRVGTSIRKSLSEVKSGIKYFLIPGVFFEEMGFKYLGPIDGHDIDALINVMERAKKIKDHPVIIHVKTIKGKGYVPAEKDSGKYHGVPPFKISTGEFLKKKSETYSNVFGNKMIELAKRDEKCIAITAAMPDGTGLTEFAKKFPDRLIDVGIAEQHAVTFAAGLSCAGLKPVVAIYSSFLQRAYDQIIHDVCIQNLPVLFAIDRGGLVGEDGETHQGVFDMSFLGNLPNMTVVAPKDKQEFENMLEFCYNYNKGPIAIRYPRGSVYIDEYSNENAIEYGKSELIEKGEETVLIAVGAMYETALEATKRLKEIGCKITLVNARFVAPIDHEMIRGLASSHKTFVTIEENIVQGGYGSRVAQLLGELGEGHKIKSFGIPNMFVEQGAREELLNKCGLTVEHLVEYIKGV